MTTAQQVLEWKKEHPERVKEHAKKYRDKNPTKNRACVDKHRENNIEKIREYDRLRKAEKRRLEKEEHDKINR